MGGVLLGLGLLAGLRVTAEGACPTAAAVEARLAPLLPQLQDVPPARAHLEPLDELLRVEVRSDNGALLTVRDLQRAAPCADLAAAAAVVIASALLSAPRALPQIAMPPAPPPTPPRPHPPAAAVPRPRPQVDAGAAVLLAAAGAGVAGGGSLVLHAAPPGRPWGVRLAVAGTALRREPLGEAGAQWTRAQLEVGPRYRLRPGRVLIDVHAHVAAALVYAAGEGFAVDYRNAGWDAGLGAGVRIGLRLGAVLPWIGVAATGYLRPQQLVVIGLAEAGALPRLDAVISLGLSAGRWQ